MRKVLTAGLVLGFGLSGIAADASAQGDRRACASCGAGTTRIYRTIHPVMYVTRYHDQAVYHHVTRLHYIVNVTRIQPIIQVRDVTRLHHLTIVRDAYAEQPRELVPLPYDQERPVNAFGAGCACVDGE